MTPKFSFCSFIPSLFFYLNSSFYKTKAMLLPPCLFLFYHKTNTKAKQNRQKTSFVCLFLSFKRQLSSANKP